MVFGAESTAVPNQRGFTLLEILLVLVIMGFAATIIGLSVDTDKRDEELNEISNEFRMVLNIALEEASMSGQQMGVVVDEEGYFFARWDMSEEQWVLYEEERLYQQREWPEGFDAILELGGLPLVQGDEEKASEFGLDKSLFEETEEERLNRPEPQLLLLPSGEMTAFNLTLIVEGEPILERQLKGDMFGRIAWDDDQAKGQN